MSPRTKAYLIIGVNAALAAILITAFAMGKINGETLGVGLATLGIPSFASAAKQLKAPPPDEPAPSSGDRS